MFGHRGHTPTMSQMYSGAVSVNTRQANRMAGAVHSNWPVFRCRLSAQRLAALLWQVSEHSPPNRACTFQRTRLSTC